MITVVTCTKDRPGFLHKCILSVQNQTFRDYQHLIYDISDTPIQVPDDPRITLVRGDKARGVATDWNIAASHAKGDLLVTLSDDDRLPRHALETISRENVTSWLVARTVIVNPDGYPLHYRGGTHESVQQTLSGSYMLGGAIAIRKSLFMEHGGYDDQFEGAADVDFYVRLIKACYPTVIPEVTYIYTDHPQTDSRVRAEHQAAQTRRAYER